MSSDYDYMSKPMDTSFIGKPHEYRVRSVYSTTATDWQERVELRPPAAGAPRPGARR